MRFAMTGDVVWLGWAVFGETWLVYINTLNLT